jgi:hypothetical protein
MVNSSPDTPGIDQLLIRIVIRQQERPEPRTRTFGIGPADHEDKSKRQQFCGFHEPGEVPSGLDNGLVLDSLSRMFTIVNHGRMT